ncbi:DUF2155 domain-containing protein [Pacificispira sp.]|uniref:DUF2155 domain-containing protein n=1 Tax=Pacificispira sp. TaxID=2888761 RepID=UPI003BAA1D12
MTVWFARLVSGVAFTAALAAGAGTASADPKSIAVLQGLDKVTARVSTFEVQIDQPIDFGALRIRVRHCDRTPPEERPEAAAFIEIDELRPGQEQNVLFTGWMFASSPGLNAVEHAVYDVWLLDCKDPQTPAPQE